MELGDIQLRSLHTNPAVKQGTIMGLLFPGLRTSTLSEGVCECGG